MKAVVIGVHLRREDVEPLARAIPAGELFLSGVDVDDDRPLGDRELLIQIAGVRAALLDRATFIAIRYGLTVSSPEEAAAKCSTLLAQWKETLEANRGNVEMTLKAAVSNAAVRPDRRDFDSGAAYLRALHETVRAAHPDPSFHDAAERLLGGRSLRFRWTPRDERSVELSLLIARESMDAIREAADDLKRETPHVPFMISGPWPLEVFADADHQ